MDSMMDPDLDRIGLFKEMSYLHGIEYQPYTEFPVFNDEANKGKQILSNCTKSKAGTQDGYFDKTFPRAFEAEGLADPIRMRRRYRLEEAKKVIGGIFKQPSPTKTQNGAGSWYGTFREYDKREEDPLDLLPREKARPKPAPELPNFKTNPAKKGGPGYAGITIGKPPPFYLEEEYDSLASKRKYGSLRKPSEELQTKPFLAGRPAHDYFDPNPYEEAEMPYTREPRRVSSTPGDAPAVKKIFKPTNPTKKDGGMKAGCLSSFPEYFAPMIEGLGKGIPSPEELAEGKSKPIFRDTHGIRIYPIRSILDANVKKEINSTNFMKVRGVMYCK